MCREASGPTNPNAPPAQSSHSTPSPSSTSTPALSNTFDRGDLLVNSLWERQTGCIIDTRVTDTDQPTYLGTSPEKVLHSQEKVKKKHYLKLCLEQRRHFTPYVVCASGMLGREAQEVNKRIAQLLAQKWNASYSATCGYVNARISIAIQRAAHLCIRGSRVPFRNASTKISLWDDGAGLRLLRA